MRSSSLVARGAAIVVACALSAGCFPGDRVVRAEVVNRCGYNVNIRLAFEKEALDGVVANEVPSRQSAIVEAVYPGRSTPLLFAVPPSLTTGDASSPKKTRGQDSPASRDADRAPLHQDAAGLTTAASICPTRRTSTQRRVRAFRTSDRTASRRMEQPRVRSRGGRVTLFPWPDDATP